MSSEATYSCVFCFRICKNANSQRNHQRLCKSNPDKQISQFEILTPEQRKEIRKRGNRQSSNGYTKAKELQIVANFLTDDGRRKLSEKNKLLNQILWTEEKREQQSEIMRRVARENPESYSSSNRGRTKQIEKYGIKFQGSWELMFYEFCLENRIECLRNYSGFDYIWNGNRTYYPDFYLPEFGTYVEIKGYKTERDVAKWSHFPKNLIIIQKNEIQLIQKKLFKINDLF